MAKLLKMSALRRRSDKRGQTAGFPDAESWVQPRKILLIPISPVLSMLFRMHLHSAVGTRKPEPSSLLSENRQKSEQSGPGFKDTGSPFFTDHFNLVI